jgi:hypothetical protein
MNRKERRMKNIMKFLIVIVLTIVLPSIVQAAGETIKTRIGKLHFTHDFANGCPTKETVKKLFDEMDFQRACQAYIWAIPIVAFTQWQSEHETTFGAKSGEIVYYPDYQSKLGLLTANATTPYALSFINLEETGPIVVEMPEAEVRGAMHSMWQIAIAAMIKPGKYLFYPLEVTFRRLPAIIRHLKLPPTACSWAFAS